MPHITALALRLWLSARFAIPKVGSANVHHHQTGGIGPVSVTYSGIARLNKSRSPSLWHTWPHGSLGQEQKPRKHAHRQWSKMQPHPHQVLCWATQRPKEFGYAVLRWMIQAWRSAWFFQHMHRARQDQIAFYCRTCKQNIPSTLYSYHTPTKHARNVVALCLVGGIPQAVLSKNLYGDGHFIEIAWIFYGYHQQASKKLVLFMALHHKPTQLVANSSMSAPPAFQVLGEYLGVAWAPKLFWNKPCWQSMRNAWSVRGSSPPSRFPCCTRLKHVETIKPNSQCL